MIRSKIICTIGPSCSSKEKIMELIQAGMNVARLNFSHGKSEDHVIVIKRLKEARKAAGVPLAIMLDTRGPEVRIGELKEKVSLKKGDSWLLVKETIVGDREKVSVTPGYVLDGLPIGTRILFDDGYVSSILVEHTNEGVVVAIENSGKLGSAKGVNIPNVSLNLPPLTLKDIEDIKLGCEHGIDFIAASFVRSAENVVTIKNLLNEIEASDVQVIAKVENYEGVENFDAILQASDGVMIARGDLGVEVPLSQVPRLQKEMIRKCYLVGKPSVTATQMLESMMQNPRPTRAEVSDIANAIYDSTSAVMLSGETAVGKHPIKSVRVMRSIIEETEEDFNYRGFLEGHSRLVYNDVPSSVTLAAVKTAYSSNASAIFAFTSRGGTARLLSRLRPKMPILVMTSNERVFHQIGLNWGVIPFFEEEIHNLEEGFAKLSQYAVEGKFVSHGDQVIVVAGSTFGHKGTTNTMMVESIGNVLIRGHAGIGKKRVYGNVTLLFSTSDAVKPYSVRGKVLVITQCDPSYDPYLKEAAGVIMQNHLEDRSSEAYLMEKSVEMETPVIVRADAACEILKEGQLVTLEPEKALVYKGVALG